jgi:hypothetical protein
MNALKGTLVAAPIVSSDNTSPEAILAREAKRLQAQAEADTKYDDKNIGDEPFVGGAEQFIDPSSYVDHRSRNLAFGAIATAGFLALVVFAARK